MFTFKQWAISIIIFLVFGEIHKSAAILCYFCADATDNEDMSDCIHKTYRLRQHRIDFESDTVNNDLKDFSYLKNCSHYLTDTQEEKFQFCKIEEVGAYGQVNSFIRDCTDMKNFSPVNVTSLRYLKADNQTICGYSHIQYATICVRVCTGDFCNGPTSGTSLRTSTVAFGVLVFVTMMRCVMM